MSRDDSDVNRRTYLKYVGGTAAAVGLAGCSDDSGDGEDTGDGGDGSDGSDDGGDEEQLPEPESRKEHLERANLRLNERAPWIFLNRQYSVYGIASRLDWDARRDERIEAQAISVTDGEPSVTITQSSMDSGLDPHDHRETPTDNIVVQAHDGVLGRNADGDIADGLATDYERLEEGRVRFEIRDGVTFHNGDPLTAEDVRYSIRRVELEEVGGALPQDGDLAGTGSLAGVEAGDGEVTVNFDGLNPIVFALFATNGQVMQRSFVENNENSFINRNTNGTGPFRVTGYQSGTSVSYERYEDYWGEVAAAEEATITNSSESSTRVNQLLAEETEIVTNVPPQEISRVEGSDVGSVSPVPSTRTIFLQMRYDVEPFSSQQFR